MTGPYDEMMADQTEEGARLRYELSEAMDRDERNGFDYLWEYQARKEQLAPPGDWRIWMIMAGRGFGKTRAGAEWVRMIADSNPDARIALVSSSLAEARAVMVEGESGLLAICRPGHKPRFEPSLHRIRFASGAQAQLFSAAEPESLRGPQHSHACRTGAEGVLRQPVAGDSRRAGTARGQRDAGRAARPAAGRRVLSGRAVPVRRLERQSRSSGAGHRRQLALHRPRRRDADVRPRRSPLAVLP